MGKTLERVLCIPFDPYDFEIEEKTLSPFSAEMIIINRKMVLAEEEVGPGLETSQGVELCTFRVSIAIPDEGKYEQ